MTIDLAERNMQYGMFTEACLGLISPNMRCVALALRGPRAADIYVALREENAIDREAIQLMSEEYWALQEGPGKFDIKIKIEVRQDPIILPLPDGFHPIFREFNYP